MEFKVFQKYTKNIEQYSAYEVDKLTAMPEEELDNYQKELEFDTGNLSDWDHIRAGITFRQTIEQLQEQVEHYQTRYENTGAIFNKQNMLSQIEELQKSVDGLSDTNLMFFNRIERYKKALEEIAEHGGVNLLGKSCAEVAENSLKK